MHVHVEWNIRFMTSHKDAYKLVLSGGSMILFLSVLIHERISFVTGENSLFWGAHTKWGSTVGVPV